MNLVRISQGYWEVLALCDDTWNCPVLEELVRLESGNKNEQGLAKKMRALLDKTANRATGPDYHNDQISKDLRDDVLEFKRPQARGPKLRVLYFYGQRKCVVTTFCFLKRDKTADRLIDDTVAVRKRYFQEVGLKRVVIRSIKETVYG